MGISLIAAVAANGVIGSGGKLPWRLPDDMARFRHLTMGRAVIMGRSTFASLRAPLAGRRNIVLSRSLELTREGCTVARSPAEALAAAGPGEAFVIGGAAVYALFLPRADRLYITWIDAPIEGDTLFPPVSWEEWRIVREEKTPAGPGDPLPHRFVDYERKPG